jgi:hypothetical protein
MSALEPRVRSAVLAVERSLVKNGVHMRLAGGMDRERVRQRPGDVRDLGAGVEERPGQIELLLFGQLLWERELKLVIELTVRGLVLVRRLPEIRVPLPCPGRHVPGFGVHQVPTPRVFALPRDVRGLASRIGSISPGADFGGQVINGHFFSGGLPPCFFSLAERTRKSEGLLL